MGDFGNAFVDFNKEFFGGLETVLGTVGSAELGADIYGGAQDIYYQLGLNDLLRG